ncbi:hypothetical protein AB0C77_17375 [Streptomyces sp. NPDC048629]|uniref:hypothetical protein n=1 Tax=Streptomyces sp. NPDC048629 TaxID=3154824 RepID=UPI003425B90C
MRSARILFAAVAAAGSLAISAPGAYANSAGDWDKDSSSRSHEKKDHHKPKGGVHTGSGALSLVSGDEWSKGDHEKKDHHKPKGGVHTGSGALSLVSGDEWSKGDHEKKDHDKPKGGVHTGSGALSLVNDNDWSKEKDKDKGKDGGWEKDKPKGGMHTGGGGLADTSVNVTGGVLVVGGLAAFVLHRRRKAAGVV